MNKEERKRAGLDLVKNILMSKQWMESNHHFGVEFHLEKTRGELRPGGKRRQREQLESHAQAPDPTKELEAIQS